MWTVCIFILVVEMCERLCYYTLQGSQRNFLEAAAGLQASAAVSISGCWSMLSYLTCMLGGYIADSRVGRYLTILCFSQVYIVGVALVAASAAPGVLSSQACLPLYLVGSLLFVALGTGAIKPNVMNFGADQYDASNPEELVQQRAFFSYFYLTINLGVVGAFGFCVNLATSEETRLGPGNGYFKAYVIAGLAMGLASLAYLAGTPRYIGKGGVLRVPTISVLRRHLLQAARTSWKARLAVAGWCLMPLAMATVLAASLLSSAPEISMVMNWAALGLTIAACALLVTAHLKNGYISALADEAAATPVCAGDVRAAFACVPTILCVNVGFNIPYNAMNNAYPAQACQMDTRLFGRQINGAFFTLGDAFAIIVFVPILEQCVFPALRRRRRGRAVTRREKYTCGFALVILANLSAAFLEYLRKSMSEGDAPRFVRCPTEDSGTARCRDGFLLSKCSPNASLPMTALSAMWTFVPMALTGIGEILVNPVVYQFVFEEAPSRLRSTIQALNLVAGGAISNAITAALSPLVPEDLNRGHLVYYYYANVGLALAMLLAYWLVSCHGDTPAEPAEPQAAEPLLTSLLASEARGASLLGSALGGPARAAAAASAPGSSLLGPGSPLRVPGGPPQG